MGFSPTWKQIHFEPPNIRRGLSVPQKMHETFMIKRDI
jgi:hypothetical protein